MQTIIKKCIRCKDIINQKVDDNKTFYFCRKCKMMCGNPNYNKEKKNYIIGSGISGLIAAFYLEDYTIISKNIGGQFKNSLTEVEELGPRFLYDNELNRKLLKDLDIKHIPIEVKVGCLYEGEVLTEFTDELKKKYYKKSRRNSLKNIVSGTMNSGRTKLRILDCNFSEIITKLHKLLKNRIIDDDVVSIDELNNVITTSSGKKLNFNKVISTVNYEIYKSLTKKEDDERYFTNVCFTFVRINDEEFNERIKGYKFVYVLDDKYDFYRITNLDNKNFYVLESRKVLNVSKNQEVVNSIFLKNCKIIKDKKLEDIKKITFLGRFAQIDSSIKIHDVIKKVMETKNESKRISKIM